ncbi:MAG TPA: hypothetical protein VJT73_15715, partial [Polyangiaceae bacterium]|nr:hypothetical protein [Polyangiaceae bacterium]
SVDKAADGDLLRIIGPTGALTLSIGIDPTGVHLVLEAATLSIRASGDLSLVAERLDLTGRKGVRLHSEADGIVSCAGELRVEAAAETIVATKGDIGLQANDDVRLEGERIYLNS